MPHCTKCGTMVGEGVAFCPNCGAPQAAATSGGAMASPAGSGTSGMSVRSGMGHRPDFLFYRQASVRAFSCGAVDSRIWWADNHSDRLRNVVPDRDRVPYGFGLAVAGLAGGFYSVDLVDGQGLPG